MSVEKQIDTGSKPEKEFIEFSYGNTYEHLNEAEMVLPDEPTCKLRWQHSWAMFIILTKEKHRTGEYIKSVTYKVPRVHVIDGKSIVDYDDFEETVTVNRTPFALQKTTFTDFYVTILIEFYEDSGLKDKQLTHRVSLQGKGKKKTLTLRVGQEEQAVSLPQM